MTAVTDLPASSSVADLVSELTLEECVSLLTGDGLWHTAPVSRLGIPSIKVTDGPNGARGSELIGGSTSACFPSGIALGAAWDPELAYEIGGALAGEARTKGASVLLGPTVNIDRSGLNGRNFECLSEDPVLTATVAAAIIEGLQDAGVAATVKHFVGNESEIDRMTINSEISERALREIYLPPFEAAVKRAGTWAVMSAYNRINGDEAGDSPRMLTGILRDEWGFDGIVMSDWFARHGERSVVSGLDLEMPGPTRDRGDKLVRLVKAGELPEEAVRTAAARIVTLIGRVGGFSGPEAGGERAVDRPEDRALIRRAGSGAIVLLRNDDKILPLDATAIRRIAVIGPNAAEAQITGGGSARVNAHRAVSPLDGVRDRLGSGVEVVHAKGCSNSRVLPVVAGPVAVEFFRTEPPLPPADSSPSARGKLPTMEGAWFGDVEYRFDGRPVMARLTATYTAGESGAHRFGIASIGRSQLFLDGTLLIDNDRGWTAGPSYFGLGSEELTGVADLVAGRAYTLTARYVGAPYGLQTADAVRVGVATVSSEGSIEEAVEAARSADVAIVFCGRTGDWDAEGGDLPGLELPGSQDELIRRVVEANPRTVVVLQTGGPALMPWLERVPAVLEAWYPGQECGHSIADVVFGDTDPGGRLPQTFPVRLADEPVFADPPATYPGADGTVRYDEGIFVGYRHFDRAGLEPLFPFGHGLSYPEFRYGDLTLDRATLRPGEVTSARVEVTNTSDRPGTEVVQLYVADRDASVERPVRELKGYRKLSLAPGETATATLEIDMRSLAFFDVDQDAWVAERGDFEVQVGRSSRDIRTRATLRLTDTWSEPLVRS